MEISKSYSYTTRLLSLTLKRMAKEQKMCASIETGEFSKVPFSTNTRVVFFWKKYSLKISWKKITVVLFNFLATYKKIPNIWGTQYIFGYILKQAIIVHTFLKEYSYYFDFWLFSILKHPKSAVSRLDSRVWSRV